jgi:hypothetical protein
MVVKRKIVARNHLRSCVALQRPVSLAKRACGIQKLRALRFVLPVGLKSLFQFSLGTHARKAKIGNGSHVLRFLDSW